MTEDQKLEALSSLQQLCHIDPQGVLISNEHGWINHSLNGAQQRKSTQYLIEALNSGMVVDLITQDGRNILRSDINSARVKLEYNTSVTPPSNGVVAWRVSPRVNYRPQVIGGYRGVLGHHVAQTEPALQRNILLIRMVPALLIIGAVVAYLIGLALGWWN